jgi:hypothetical protein
MPVLSHHDIRKGPGDSIYDRHHLVTILYRPTDVLAKPTPHSPNTNKRRLMPVMIASSDPLTGIHAMQWNQVTTLSMARSAAQA